MDFRLEFDIWDNVSYIKTSDSWYKQTFFEDEIVKYEDSLGNYWVKEFGEFPFLMVKFDFSQGIDDDDRATTTLSFDVINKEICYSFSHLLFVSSPRIRNTLPTPLISSDLISIQPMSTPTANIHYFDVSYGKETWFQKIKNKFYLVMSKIYRIFVPDKLKTIKL